MANPLLSRACVVGMALGWSLGAAGCVILSEPVYLDALPNRPPRLIEESAQPQRRVSVPALPGCSITFRIQAEDPDVNDTLVARWYIDYDPSTNPSPYSESALTYADPVENGPRQRVPATLTVHLDAANNPLPVGEHVVEVLVADGTVVGRVPTLRPPIGTFPDGGLIADTNYVVTYPWFVTVSDEGTACP